MTTATISKKKAIEWLITIFVPLLIWFVAPTNDVYTPTLNTYFLVTLICIFMFVFELLPSAIIGLCLTLGYPLLKVCDLSTALSSWSMGVVFQTIALLILLECLQNTTILKRISFKLASAVSGSYLGILLGITLSGIAFAILVPSATACFLNMALAIGLIHSLGLKAKEPAAAGIMMMSMFGTLDAQNFLYSVTGIGLNTNLIAAIIDGFNVSYMEIIWHNIVFIPQVFVLTFIYSKIFKVQKKLNGKEYFNQELEKLGKMDSADKKALVVLLLMLLFLVTSSLHGLDMTLGFIAACIILYLPGINIGTEENIKNISLGFPVVVASCMAIGTIGSEIGVGKWFTSLIGPFLQGQGGFTFVLFTLVSGILANILMTPMALVTILTGPFVDVAQTLGISPEVVAYTFQHASCDVFFPYENNGTLMCFSFAMMSMGQFMKGAIARMIIDIIFVLLLGVLWWTVIGLI